MVDIENDIIGLDVGMEDPERIETMQLIKTKTFQLRNKDKRATFYFEKQTFWCRHEVIQLNFEI